MYGHVRMDRLIQSLHYNGGGEFYLQHFKLIIKIYQLKLFQTIQT